MIQIICNRCNKHIESIEKVGFIQFCYHNPFESVTDDNISSRNHYCEDCMTEIEQFIGGKVDANIDLQIDGQMMAKVMEEIRKEALKHKEREIAAANTAHIDRKEEPQDQEKKIDAGKIGALYKAGWSVPKIMDEMDLTESEVLDVVNGIVERD